MQTRVGVWIDHREAVIVVVTDTGEDIRLIKGPYESQPCIPHKGEGSQYRGTWQ